MMPRRKLGRSLRKISRRALRRLLHRIAAVLGPPLLRLWMGSIDYRLISPTSTVQSAIYLFWHQRMLGFAYTHRERGFRVLISSHDDGETMARVVQALGFSTVRGSSTRGGPQALRELLNDAATGEFPYAFTPDGPRGPRHVLQPGAVYLASRSGLRIVPISVSYSRCWKLPTWDEFIVPRPGCRALMLAAEPVSIPANLEGDELETWRSRVEATLRRVTTEAEERFEELYAAAPSLAEHFRERGQPRSELQPD